MKVNIRADKVEIEGYVNAIERDSKPLWSRVGQFVERICKGAFKKALKRNDDVHILLNHDWKRDLGSTKAGNLKLEEDNIGLKARATITDPEVIKKARAGELVGWSFGFSDRDVVNSIRDGMPHRAVKDLDLTEVSILDRRKSPAYEGTLITARAEEDVIHFRGEDFIDEIEAIEVESEETQEEPETQPEETASIEDTEVREETSGEEQKEVPEEAEPKQQEIVDKKIDYSKYEEIIAEMKEEK
jgi:HK97 family phage prohead protease